MCLFVTPIHTHIWIMVHITKRGKLPTHARLLKTYWGSSDELVCWVVAYDTVRAVTSQFA